jgi:uncharacterized membrane protein HdeD (DUF308 family)
MFPKPLTDPLNPRYEECMRLSHCSGWFLVLGIILIVVGALAVGSAFITTFAFILVFGILLLVGGTVQVVNAFLARSWGGFFVLLLAGLLQFVAGGLMIEHEKRAAVLFTLLLAIAFVVGGIMRIVFALRDRFPDWEWVLLNGVITLILGLAIWRQWPSDSIWVIGLFVGIDLIFSGWSWVMLGLLVKGPAPQPQPAQPATSPPAPAGTV